MKKFITVLALAIYGLGLDSTLLAQGPGTVHVLMYIDEESGISGSCMIDKKEMTTELTKVENETYMTVKYHPIGGFSAQAASKAIDALRCSSNDVILFFYSGHGYRYNNQSSKFPYMAFSHHSSEVVNSYMLSLKEVSDKIKTKGARLTLVLGDLCNSTLPVSQPAHMALEDEFPSIYKSLFLNAKGNVISASSAPGQTSIAPPGRGSVWAAEFVKVVRKASAERKSKTWSEVLEETKANVIARTGGKMIPVFEVNTTQMTPTARPASIGN